MKKTAILTIFLSILSWGTVEARDEVRIVGSSAVMPFIQTVAENFAVAGNLPQPCPQPGDDVEVKISISGAGYEDFWLFRVNAEAGFNA